MKDAGQMTTDDVVETVPLVWRINVAGQRAGTVALEFDEKIFIGFLRKTPFTDITHPGFNTLEEARDWVVAEHYKRTVHKTSQEKA